MRMQSEASCIQANRRTGGTESALDGAGEFVGWAPLIESASGTANKRALAPVTQSQSQTNKAVERRQEGRHMVFITCYYYHHYHYTHANANANITNNNNNNNHLLAAQKWLTLEWRNVCAAEPATRNCRHNCALDKPSNGAISKEPSIFIFISIVNSLSRSLLS